MQLDNYQKQREQMVKNQLKSRGIDDEAVLEAFLTVPREKFVPEARQQQAYRDDPLPIGEGQTISQPYIVAVMVQALNPKSDDKVLEIGAGSGYVAAILSQIVDSVYGVERYNSLVDKAETKLEELNCTNVTFHLGDGTKGWPEFGPYDGILVSAAAPEIPTVLLEQLTDGGYLVIPAGSKRVQKLYQVKQLGGGEIEKNKLGNVRFVPLIGEHGW